MDECQHAMEELRNIVEGISNLRDTAYAHYSLLVEQVLKDQITDEQQLEQILKNTASKNAHKDGNQKCEAVSILVTLKNPSYLLYHGKL